MKYDLQMAAPDCGHIFEVTHAWVGVAVEGLMPRHVCWRIDSLRVQVWLKQA